MNKVQIANTLLALSVTQRNMPVPLTEDEHTALREAAHMLDSNVNDELVAQLFTDAEKVGILAGFTMRRAARALQS